MLDGGAGPDTLTGGAGRDLFLINDMSFGDGGDFIVDFEPHSPAGNDFLGDTIDISALMDQFTSFTGTNADQAWAQGYLYFKSYGEQGTPYFGTSVYIDLNGRAPDGEIPDFQVARLNQVAPDQLGAIGQEFFGYSHHFIV